MTRRLLGFAAAATVLVTLAACSLSAASVTGTWRAADGMTLRLDADGTAELDETPISVLNVSGPIGTTVSDIVGTWALVDERVVAEFETQNGRRELVLRAGGSGDSESLAIETDDPRAEELWLARE
jgi:hypothetical protein